MRTFYGAAEAVPFQSISPFQKGFQIEEWECRQMGRARGGRRVVGGRDNTKHKGGMAEMEFMWEAGRRRFGVARPFVDNERYDVIVDAPRRLWRVQVKASGAAHHQGFAVRASWRSSQGAMPYTAEQIDFLAVVIESRRTRGRRIWYLIPVRALGGRLTINLYPFGCRKGGEERFEKYREAWGLLA
jgi:PD-(D/E)XK endonuclease